MRVDLKSINLRRRHLGRASTTIDAVLRLPSTPFEGTTSLERSGTATRGGLAGDGRAMTTVLRIDGSPGDLHGPGRPTGIYGDRDGLTSTDGQSREGRRREVRIVDEIKL